MGNGFYNFSKPMKIIKPAKTDGSTVADPGLNKSDLTFSSSIEVTFTLGGISLNTGVVVFVIDVVGMATDISAVTATIDSIVIN
ncbi:hypothetical protein [Yeosuana marina]|uniref:hypothetical protein n=1 Tax=Yeosuana marina TaxID=1565536 RepID=UPI0030C7B8C6